MTVAPTRYQFENGFILKIDSVSERQFQALNHWKTARAVSEIVSAFAISLPAYMLKRYKVPIAIVKAIKGIRRTMRASMRYFFGRSKVPRKRPFSFGSIASATVRKPSVTKLSQIIWEGKSGKGSFRKSAPMMTNTSPRLVEKRYRMTFLIVL